MWAKENKPTRESSLGDASLGGLLWRGLCFTSFSFRWPHLPMLLAPRGFSDAEGCCTASSTLTSSWQGLVLPSVLRHPPAVVDTEG